MAVLPVGFGASGGYTIDRSLRFRSSASAYLSRTPASAGNRKTWTWSGWVKRGSLGVYSALFACNNAAGGGDEIGFTNADALQLGTNGGNQIWLVTSQVFRDPSAWYHIVASVDTTQATASNRAKLYVNGVQVTALGTATYPTQNADTTNFNTTSQHLLGGGYVSLDGYMTEVNFIDGQALDPTYFGEYNEDTGVWQPIKYTGTYGTNGFYLNFSDNTSTTTLGYDTSGNGNNWTANNISLTSGVTYDSMTDVPTLTSEDAANYATLNPLDKYSSTIGTSEANLKLISTSGGAYQQIRNTFGMSSGKWYMEWVLVSQGTAGRTGASLVKSNSPLSGAAGSDLYSWVYHATGSAYFNNTTIALSTGALALGDLVMYAFDVDTGSFWMGKNGTWANSGNPTTGANPLYTGLTADAFFFGGWAYNTSDVVAMNFGQRPFAYTPPAGFKSLNTYNLPDSTIVDGGEYFNAVLWTGDGSETRSITDTNFQPDMVWMKLRTGTTQVTQVYDSVRGVGGGKGLSTAETYAEGTMNGGYLDSDYGYISSLDASGFSVNDGAVATTGGWVNYASRLYVAWNWKANGSGVSNTDGSITSTVSANTTAGFSIVTYTGNYNGSSGTGTLGHGLNTTPSLIIIKNRDSAYDWAVGHSSVGWTQAGLLNLNNAFGPSLYFNSTAPTASVFSVGQSNITNQNLSSHVAYCFADVEGYSKFGSYTGNGSADGPFVYTGFRPAFLIVKRTDSTAAWNMRDSERNPNNPLTLAIYANESSAESDWSLYPTDLLSNGFKVRTNAGGTNASGGTYIYMAFADNPFKNALAR